MSSKQEDDGRVARMKDMLVKSGGPRGGPGLILPKPKPKPKPKPAEATREIDQPDGRDGMVSTSPPLSPMSPGMEDPGSIVLNTDSLRQFSDTLDYDFDAVVRQQILDSTPQKDRAALSQSKGLQNRRLPSNVAGKVPEDYSERRRANTYSGNLKRAVKQPAMEDSIDGPEISEEERKQKNLAKLGVQHTNNPLAGLAGLLKRNSSGRGSFSKKAPKSPQRSQQGSPGVLPKKKKKGLDVSPSRLGSEPPQSLPKSPKGFLRGLRRSSSRSKKNGGDDMASETSSIVSLPIHTSPDETPNVTPAVTPLKSAEKSAPRTTNGVSETDNTPAISVNGDFSPLHTSSPQLVPLRDKTSSTSPSGNRKTTDSAIFKTGSYENLFSSTSNLFDSKELDDLMGKKKEKTPDREAGLAEEDTTDGVTVSPILKKKVVEKKSNGPIIAIHPAVSKPAEKKRSIDSSIRANLHRYESNSSVSKSSVTSESSIKEEPIKESLSESVTEPEKPIERRSPEPYKKSPEPSKEPEKPIKEKSPEPTSMEKRSHKSPEPPKEPEKPIGEKSSKNLPPEPKKKAPKPAEKPSRSPPQLKKKAEKPDISPEPRKKASLLFEECEDDLFGPVKTDKPIADDKPVNVKKASLFDDDDEELFAVDKPTQKKESAPAFLQDSKVPEPSKKKAHDLFGDSLEAEVEQKDSKVPEPSKKTHDLFGEADKDAASKSQESSKKKSHDLFGDSLDDSFSAVLEEATPTKKDDTRRKSKEDVLDDAVTRRKSKETVLENVDVKVREGEVAVKAETKKKDEVDFFDVPEVSKKNDDLFGENLFDVPETRTKSPQHASLFDEDKGSPSLFSRERKALSTNLDRSSHISGGDDLFTDKSPKSSPKSERARKIEVTDVDSFDPLGAFDSGEPDDNAMKSGAKAEGSSPVEDAKDQLPDLVAECEDIAEDTTKEVSKTTEEDSKAKQSTTSKAAGRKDAGADSKSSRASKGSGKEESGKPAWMTELKKKRKEDGAAPPAAATKKKEPVEPAMPEWKKKALERKKKAESGERPSAQIPKKKEPSEAPVPEWKKKALERKKKAEEATSSTSKVGRSSPARSPLTGRKTGVKTTVGGRNSPLSERKSPATEKEVSKSSLTSRSKTRADREKEEKEKEVKEKEKEVEKEVKEKEKKVEKEKEEITKTEDTDSSEVKPRCKTKREREEKEGKEVKVKEEITKKEDAEMKSDRLEKEKESSKQLTTSSESKPRKTRLERQKEREEMQRKADAEVAELKLKYKAKREKEKEEKEKADREKKEERSRYKTRREREQEAKEKEEKEKKEAKEKESIRPRDSPSPTKSKPPLSKKPSIEIISRKKLSSTSRSSEAGDERKSSLVDDNQGSRKEDTDDDVFSAGDVSEQRSTSNLSLRRTPSPKISLDILSTVLTPADVGGEDVLENGHAKEEKKKTTLLITTSSTVSPTHAQNGSTSSKSSVSSDRDLLAEPKPTRSQTISLSSRSPTPPASSAKASDSVPEWKRQLMERKKSSSSPVHKSAPRTVELSNTDSDIPQWKRDLLAKKKTKPEESGPRSNRSATVNTTSSSSRARGKEPAPTPDFMKEFQKKKIRNS